MNNLSKYRSALWAGIFAMIAAAFLMPVFYDFAPLGINVPVIVAGLYAALFFAMKGKLSLKRQNNWILLIFIAASALQFAFFNNGLLHFLNVVLLVILVSVQILLMTGNEIGAIFSGKLFINVTTTTFFRPYHRIKRFYKGIFTSEDSAGKKTVLGVLLGVAICVPILAVLLALLTSGDVVFGRMVRKIFSVDTVRRISVFVLILSVVFTQFGSFSTSLQQWKLQPSGKERPRAKFNFIAVLVITVAICILMMVFSAVQLVYLTGISQLPEGFVYSEYAREGFFQLCAAAAIVFAVVVVCSRYTKHAEGGMRILLNTVYTALAASVMGLLVSSFARMVMYEQQFRFTRLRLYTQAFMIMLAVITILLIVKIWCEKFPVFRAVFYTVAASLILLSYFNVDGFIARDAVEYAERTDREVDFEYLTSLSIDALAEYGMELETEDVYRQKKDFKSDFTEEELELYWEDDELYWDVYNTAQNLDKKIERLEKSDFRTYNVNQRRAESLLDEDIKEAVQEMIFYESQY